MHTTLFDESGGDCHIPFRPRATQPSRSEFSPESALVNLRKLSVHPTVTDRFVEGLLIRQGRRVGRSLLRQDQPDTLGLCAPTSKPLRPRSRVGHRENRGLASCRELVLALVSHPL